MASDSEPPNQEFPLDSIKSVCIIGAYLREKGFNTNFELFNNRSGFDTSFSFIYKHIHTHISINTFLYINFNLFTGAGSLSCFCLSLLLLISSDLAFWFFSASPNPPQTFLNYRSSFLSFLQIPLQLSKGA